MSLAYPVWECGMGIDVLLSWNNEPNLESSVVGKHWMSREKNSMPPHRMNQVINLWCASNVMTLPGQASRTGQHFTLAWSEIDSCTGMLSPTTSPVLSYLVWMGTYGGACPNE